MDMRSLKSRIFGLFFTVVIFDLHTGTLPVSAQTDTLRLTNGQEYPVLKLNPSISAIGRIKVNLEHFHENKTLEIPLKDIASIRFSDGFEVSFSDGLPVRDNLLAAPRFTAANSSILVEGLIPLNQNEIRSLYGESLYRYGYQSFRRMQWVGLGKTGIGIAGWVVSHSKNPSVWINRKYFDTINVYHETLSGTDYTIGDLSPDWLAASSFFVGLIVDGIVDCGLSANLQKRLLENLSNGGLPTPRQINAHYMEGGAMIAAGLGTMAGCYAYLCHHRTWFWDSGINKGQEGEIPVSKMTWVWMTGGAFLTHFGVSMIETGALENRLRRHVSDRPVAVQCSFGPAEHGYGLTLRF